MATEWSRAFEAQQMQSARPSSRSTGAPESPVSAPRHDFGRPERSTLQPISDEWPAFQPIAFAGATASRRNRKANRQTAAQRGNVVTPVRILSMWTIESDTSMAVKGDEAGI